MKPEDIQAGLITPVEGGLVPDVVTHTLFNPLPLRATVILSFLELKLTLLSRPPILPCYDVCICTVPLVTEYM